MWIYNDMDFLDMDNNMDVEICKIAFNSVIKLLMFLIIKWSLYIYIYIYIYKIIITL